MKPQEFTMDCFCACEDKPYTMRFAMQPNRKYKWVESVKGEITKRKPGLRIDVVATIPVSMDQIERSFPCAWCSSRSINFCGADCGAFVCGGRMIGKLFICRDSCGAKWTGEPLKELKGETRHECLASPSHVPMMNKPVSSTAMVRSTGSVAVVSKPSWRSLIRK